MAVLCATGLLGVLPPVSAAPVPAEFFRSGGPRIPGEVVVSFDPASPSASRSAARAAVDGERTARLGPPGLELIELDGTTVPDAIAELERRPDVLYAEPNFVVSALAVPNDPYFSHQWALDDAGDVDVNAPRAWDTTTGSDDVVVAVVDTGVAWDHPDLAENVWTNPGESGEQATNGIDDDNNGYVDDTRGWDWVDDDNDPMDVSGHGTHVAGTVAARGNNGRGVSGVAWGTKVLPLRVLSASGAGGSADVAKAFWYAADAGARVVNASFGTTSFSQVVSDSIAQNPDVLFVAAAGNESRDNEVTPLWPCSLTHPNVVCVTAVARDNSKPGFANVGSTTVDIAAPGTSILSTSPNLSTRWTETFETDVPARWDTGGTSSWGPGPGVTGSGFTDSPGANYAGNADSWLATRTGIDTSGTNACALHYALKLDTARPDVLVVEKSVDGSSWQRVNSYFGSTEGRWLEIADDLGDVGSQLFVRFRLLSDASTSLDGASIDDVWIQCAMSDYGNDYMYSSGTSMASPHVAGVAGLLFSASPSSSPASIRSALLQTATPVPALAGRIASGGRVDAAAAMALVKPAPVDVPDEDVPTPDATVAPDPAVTPEPTVTPDPVVTPDPTVAPDPVVTPEPTLTPAPDAVDHARSITARLVRGPRIRGTVTTVDGYSGCDGHVRVRILRNGRFLKGVSTDATGKFSAKVPSRTGRYRAVVNESTPAAGHLCLPAGWSTVR